MKIKTIKKLNIKYPQCDLTTSTENFFIKVGDKYILTHNSPAIILWSKFGDYPDNSICLKSFVNGSKNAIYTPEQIFEKYGDRPEMAEKLQWALSLAKRIPEGEAWQGDCMFVSSDKKEENIKGTDYITFQPNKIVYAFSEKNPDYDLVKNAKFSIAFHTIYYYDENNNLKQSFKIDPQKIDAPNDIYLLSPVLNYNKNSFDVSDIRNKYDELEDIENIFFPMDDYEKLVNNEAFMSYWNTFENANIADKRKVTLDINTFWDDLWDYIEEKRTGEWTKKNLSMKTVGGRSKAFDTYIDSLSELKNILTKNKKLLTVLVKAFNLAAEIKMDMWNGFKQSKAGYSTFYKSKTKGIIDADMEGVAMSDSEGNIVKIVDRSTFSANNRDDDILVGWQHPENKLGEALEDANIIVIAFGRMNPPTIGHQKLVNKMKEYAQYTGNKAMLFLSHSVDKKNEFKNPLPYDIKLNYVKKAFEPDIEVADSNAKTIINALHELYTLGYTDVIYVGGDDRIGGDEDMTSIITKYNGYDKAKEDSYYKFNSIHFMSAGERDESSNNLAVKASGSLARKYVLDGDKDSFISISPLDEKDASELFDILNEIAIQENKK